MLRAESGSVKETLELPLLKFRDKLHAVFASGHGRVATLLAAGILLAWPACHAVLFKSTASPTYNTTAPSGALTNSGWQSEGEWGSFLGTPVAPTFFLAAKHVGGTNGQVFSLNGFSYHAITNYPDANSDLQIWKVAETFPAYAMLYTNTNELGKHCVAFGRGLQRGPAVIIGTPAVTNGWAWGAGAGVKRWGENDVAAVSNYPAYGPLIRCSFDRNGGSNECHLTVNDSSGALFIQDGGTWKLAGIHYLIDDSFISTNGVNGSGFNAAMLDYGGVYLGGDNNWQLISNKMTDIPASFYSTRISSRVAWINSVIDFQPGNDLRITAIQRAANNMLISFATGANKMYRVDWRADPSTGGWATLTNGIVGTGGIMTVTDVGAATLPKRFYRLVLVP